MPVFAGFQVHPDQSSGFGLAIVTLQGLFDLGRGRLGLYGRCACAASASFGQLQFRDDASETAAHARAARPPPFFVRGPLRIARAHPNRAFLLFSSPFPAFLYMICHDANGFFPSSKSGARLSRPTSTTVRHARCQPTRFCRRQPPVLQRYENNSRRCDGNQGRQKSGDGRVAQYPVGYSAACFRGGSSAPES